MDTLREVFEISGLMLDKDGDGVKDTFDGNIWVKEDDGKSGVRLALNLAARIGRECLGYDRIPVIRRWEEGPKRGFVIEKGEVSGIYLDGDCVKVAVRETDSEILENYICRVFPKYNSDTGITVVGIIGSQDPKRSNNLTGIELSSGAMDFIYNDGEYRVPFPMYDVESDFAAYSVIIIPDDIDYNEMSEIGDIAFKIGLESIHMDFPLTIYEGQATNIADYKSPIVIGPSRFYDGCERGVSLVGEHGLVYINRNDLKEVSDYFLRFYPYIDKDSVYPLKGIEEVVSRHLSGDREIKKKGKVSDRPEWEVDEVKRIVREMVIPKIGSGDSIEINCAVSEDERAREELKNEIVSLISPIAGEVKTDVLSSYKQGYYWIKEKVIPAAKAYEGRISRVVITFMEEGEAHRKGDYRVPNPDIFSEDKAESLEIPIRWLLELYPADKIISRELSIPVDSVIFEPGGRHTYGVFVYDGEDLLMSDFLDATVHPMRYIGCFSDTQAVSPETGYIRVSINGESYIEEEIAPDSIRIWERFQDMFSGMWKIIKESDGNEVRFDGIDFDISLSGVDEDLPFDEDRISQIEALEEDIYFVTLDFMKMAGIKSGKPVIPGLIRPMIHSRYGPPAFDAEYRIMADKVEGGITLAGVEPHDGMLTLRFKRGNTDEISINVTEDDEALRLLSTDGDKVADLPKSGKHDINVPNEVIGYEEYVSMVLGIARPGLDVEHVATSIAGRYVYAVYMHSPLNDEVVSRNKWYYVKPTILINCRHHANEVSSTNAAFMLIEDTLKDINRLKGINIVLIPEENVDGSAFLDELITEHPKWKHHPARYNAAGLEFAHDYWHNPKGEAKALPRVAKKVRPTIFLDAHGVPSHEWDQPFSGYTSPSFRGFWLPRSFIYYYFWETASVSETSMRLKQRIKKNIKEILDKSPWVIDENKSRLREFNRYMGQWMKEIAGGDPEDGLFFDVQVNSGRHLNEISPNVTYIDMTSEVIDEVAHGEHLRKCSEVHLLGFKALIKCMNERNERGDSER